MCRALLIALTWFGVAGHAMAAFSIVNEPLTARMVGSAITSTVFLTTRAIGTTLYVPARCTGYKIQVSGNNSGTAAIHCSEVSMDMAAMECGEETGWVTFGVGASVYPVVQPTIIHGFSGLFYSEAGFPLYVMPAIGTGPVIVHFVTERSAAL